MKRKNLYWLFTVCVVVLGVFGTYEYFNAKSYRRSLEDTYSRAFYELTDYVDDIDTLLAKSMLASSAGEMATISRELSIQANSAKACLAQIPMGEVQLETTEKFLSQVGDYTYVLSQSVINKNSVSEQEYKNLDSLGNYATTLNNALEELSKSVQSGDVSFGVKNRDFIGSVYAADEEPFSAVEKEFGEYPSLIYDGPFSEHIENMKPKLLDNTKKITKSEAIKKASEFLGIEENKIEVVGETENSNMDAYVLRGIGKGNEISISVTKRGGFVVYFLENRRVRTEKLTIDEAMQKAASFLEGHGYTDMQTSYFDKNGGVATINFAFCQNNIVCYSDLIKVKVALDSGDIVGMEAKGYIMNHAIRDIRKPALTSQEAREKVSSHLEIDSMKIALIPKDSGREILCYEFRGKSGDRNFLIYINAETGNEEDIQLLIESDDGILTA